MADEKFKLPGSSYEELTKIVKAYNQFSAPIGPTEVGKVAVVHSTVISRNNWFLLGVGIVEGGNKKQITEPGVRLARALEFEMPDDIRSAWRFIVEQNEFLQKLVSAVRIRKTMDQSTLRAHVAYSAGQPKTPDVLTGAGTVVNILVAAGLLKEEDGKLTAPPPPDDEAYIVETSKPVTIVQSVVPFDHAATAGSTMAGGLAAQMPPIQIQLQIQCSAADLDDLGTRLRLLLRELASPSDPASGDGEADH